MTATTITTQQALAPGVVPAIRTPDVFEEAIERATILLVSAQKCDPDSFPDAEELDTLREAIAQAPFVLRDGRAVSKGFVPVMVQ